MTLVRAQTSISLDGFTSGPDVSTKAPMGTGGRQLHTWLFSETPDPVDAAVAAAMFSPETTGAVILGRTTFDVGIGEWGEDGAFGLPCFVMTHRPAPRVVRGRTSFDFVLGGPEAVLAAAVSAAGNKAVNVMGAATIQSFMRLGLLSELHLNLVPVLLGAGATLFPPGSGLQGVLEQVSVRASATVTHLSYRVRPTIGAP
jgi:dihydrofolate reductase